MIETKYIVNGQTFDNYKDASEYDCLYRKEHAKFKINDIVYYISLNAIHKDIVTDLIPVTDNRMMYELQSGSKKFEHDLYSSSEELCEFLLNNVIDDGTT